MRLRTAPLNEKLNTWLHLLLVVGVFAYLYSPLVDHLRDSSVYSRPHTHIYVAGNILPQPAPFSETDPVAEHSDHDEQDENVICLLNIDALLSLLLSFFIVPDTLPTSQDSLGTSLVATYLDVSIIYLASVDPPPNI
jgi:hypothetical protein